MKLFFKIVAALLILGALCFGIALECFGWGIGYKIDSKRSWNEVKNLPIVSAMGHWNEITLQEIFPLKSDVLPKGISKSRWIEIVEGEGFVVDEEKGKCGVGIYAVEFLNTYDTCAMKIIGPSSCSYSYYVAANFKDEKMSEVVGTLSHFICL